MCMSRWCEHDPLQLWDSVCLCVEGALAAAREAVGEVRVVAIGITNQRETALVWDRHTGHPLHNAIVWHDSRTAAVCSKVTADLGAVRSLAVPPQPSVVWTVTLPVCSRTLKQSSGPGAACSACFSLLSQVGQVLCASKHLLALQGAACAGSADSVVTTTQDYFRPVTGLPVSTYFSAYKWRWLQQHVPAVAEAVVEGRGMLGTVDTWLLYKLSGGVDGALSSPSRPAMVVLSRVVPGKHCTSDSAGLPVCGSTWGH